MSLSFEPDAPSAPNILDVRAGRLSAFLRFIVEEAAAGRADGLKETVIGAAVFGKPPGYDPRADSTVRIQAARLREKLRVNTNQRVSAASSSRGLNEASIRAFFD